MHDAGPPDDEPTRIESSGSDGADRRAPNDASCTTGNGSWTEIAHDNSTILYAIWGSGAGDVFTSGMVAPILHSTGNGMWTTFAYRPQGSVVRSMWGTSTSNIYAVGEAGTVLHYH